MNQPKTREVVLIWLATAAHFRELGRLAKLLSTSEDYTPLVWFHSPYPGDHVDQATCRSLGIRVLPDKEEMKKLSVWQRIRMIPFSVLYLLQLLYLLFGQPFLFSKPAVWLRSYRANQKSRRFLKALAPRIMIFPEDNVEWVTGTLIRRGHDLGVPSMIIPYTIADAKEPAESYWNNRDHNADHPKNVEAAKLYPHWVYEHRGKRLIRLPATRVFDKERSKLAPPKPWILNSGFADLIALESEALRHYYLRAGLPDSQLRVTGSLRLDDLTEVYHQRDQKRQDLLQQLGWPANTRVILTALPPDQKPSTRPQCEYTDYSILLRDWVGSLARFQNIRVIVNPHPRITEVDLIGLENDRVKIVREQISRLIPLCDLYVASVSATIPLALACGIPVVNYDVYQYCYDDFTSSRLLYTVNNHDEYRSALDRWHDGQIPSSACEPEWGNLDGQSTRRLLETMQELIKKYREKP